MRRIHPNPSDLPSLIDEKDWSSGQQLFACSPAVVGQVGKMQQRLAGLMKDLPVEMMAEEYSPQILRL